MAHVYTSSDLLSVATAIGNCLLPESVLQLVQCYLLKVIVVRSVQPQFSTEVAMAGRLRKSLELKGRKIKKQRNNNLNKNNILEGHYNFLTLHYFSFVSHWSFLNLNLNFSILLQ